MLCIVVGQQLDSNLIVILNLGQNNSPYPHKRNNTRTFLCDSHGSNMCDFQGAYVRVGLG